MVAIRILATMGEICRTRCRNEDASLERLISSAAGGRWAPKFIEPLVDYLGDRVHYCDVRHVAAKQGYQCAHFINTAGGGGTRFNIVFLLFSRFLCWYRFIVAAIVRGLQSRIGAICSSV